MGKLKSIGIHLYFHQDRGWSSRVEYSSMEHAQANCIDGEIGPRYVVGDLSKAIDQALEAARSIGVEFLRDAGVEPGLYVEGDGEDPSKPLPQNWRQLLVEQSERLGWRPTYQSEPQTTHAAPSMRQ